MNYPPLILFKKNEIKSWDQWLKEVEVQLKLRGYRKFNQNLHHEDFAYWKIIYDGNRELYQIGVFFYDFRKYSTTDPRANKIQLEFECMLLNTNSRIELVVEKELNIEDFEDMSKDFYDSMKTWGEVLDELKYK